MKFRDVKLPSGATLKIKPAFFAESKALYMVLLDESKGVNFSSKNDFGNALKDAFSIAVSSKKVEAALWVCMGHCIYNSGTGDLKIDQDTFEPVKAREDYTLVCREVIEENVGPFAKGLYVEFQRLMAMIDSILS